MKSILKKSAIVAATIASTTAAANAKIQYNVGLGFGLGLFEFNGTREDSAFQGNTTIGQLGLGGVDTAVAGGLNGGSPALRTTYKYVGNQPQKTLYLETGVTKSFEEISLLNKNLFIGANLNFAWGKSGESEGLTNPNGNYASTGSTSLFFGLNTRFGLENSYSKLYGLLGFTWARTDLPYDILPFGTETTLGDLATCTVFAENSTLLQSVGNATLNGVPIPTIATAIQNACNKLNVDSATYNTYFINIGAGMELAVFKNSATLFAEIVHLMQINRNKTLTVDYTTATGAAGTFSGKVRTTNTTYIRAGFRYYFG